MAFEFLFFDLFDFISIYYKVKKFCTYIKGVCNKRETTIRQAAKKFLADLITILV